MNRDDLLNFPRDGRDVPDRTQVNEAGGCGRRLLEHQRQLEELLRYRDDMASAASGGSTSGQVVGPAERSALLGRLNDAIREKQTCLTRARRSGS